MARYHVKGMSCAACSANVDKAVRKLPFVEDVQVDLLSGAMKVETNDGQNHELEVVSAVENAGYQAASDTPEKQIKPIEAKEDQPAKRLIWSAVLLVPLMIVGMEHMLGLPVPYFLKMQDYPMTNALVQLLLATPVLFINRSFFTVGFRHLWKRTPNMDSLIAVGSGAAYLYGVIVLLRMSMAQGDALHALSMNLYFESAAMILTLVTLGRTLEARAKGRTTDAIQKLMALAPDTAAVIRDGKENVIPLQQVIRGDVLIIRPGERIPVDGVLLEGEIAVDQSHITGESIPAEKQKGDPLIAGSLNPSATFRMEATNVGEDTTLQKIVRLVSEAGASKAPIAKLADTISGVFVPIVLSIAAITFAVWMLLGYELSFALNLAISVLVISCPCALGLATPVAIMVGTGVGASHGLLFRNGEALETLHRVRSVVFDKTGTLTEGKMTVQRVISAGETTEQELLKAALSLEKNSEHPLAKAVVDYAETREYSASDAEEFRATAGFGVSARIDGAMHYAGKPAWMKENNIDMSSYQKALEEAGKDGASVLCFAKGDQVLGFIGVSDTIRSDAKETVRLLNDLSVKPYLLTGDRVQAAQRMAEEAGITDVIAEVLPAEKAEHVIRLQEKGESVAMIGDGINDAPALKQANVGIAMGSGTDIAMETADVIIGSHELMQIPNAIRLSRSVIRNIKQNLFWAFFYNVIGIPIAAGLLYPSLGLTLSPMIAAGAMSLSSVFVVTNALRLKSFTVQTKEETIMKQRTMLIDGMSCNHCKMNVEKALNAVSGVSAAQVDLQKKTAIVTVDDNVKDEELRRAVDDAGYRVDAIS